jgi:hypothetical protein
MNTTIDPSSDEDEEMHSIHGADDGTSSPSSWRIQLSITPTPPPSPRRLVDTTLELSSDDEDLPIFVPGTDYGSSTPRRLVDTTVELSSDDEDLPSSVPGINRGMSSPSSTRATRGSEANEDEVNEEEINEEGVNEEEVNEEDIETDVEPLYDSP